MIQRCPWCLKRLGFYRYQTEQGWYPISFLHPHEAQAIAEADKRHEVGDGICPACLSIERAKAGLPEKKEVV